MLKILEYDPYLSPYEDDLLLRMNNYKCKLCELVGKGKLCDFANGHEYFGFHKENGGWYYREWAPAADEVYLTGDMVDWHWLDLRLTRLENGIFEIFLEGENALWDGCHVKTVIKRGNDLFERIPTYATRVEHNPETNIWCAVIEDKPQFEWKNEQPKPPKNPLIYECHIGMAQQEARCGTYREFKDNILPRIKSLGYNTLQIMAIMEHPYYASFGYQVSSFFAPSSRFGTADELRELIDAAHGMGLAVLLDLVHSHAVKNTVEGLNEFDGTSYQFFHEGARGEHPAWSTKLFNYGKNEVLHFLLSNLKYWLTEFKFDGFRFDGVTSMLYHDHGLGVAFTDYSKYFSMNTDTEAVTYLQLANVLIREVNKNAITIAEDMSGMPGMCLPVRHGGIGFDYRLQMGQPDMWIRLIRDYPDEFWNMWTIWGELCGKRPHEKTIGYAESHDQALVGDKTIMFRLCDAKMYTDMSSESNDAVIERGMALHKMIRFITFTAGGDGYLNFMGNEFGHPEWIDFPRAENGWSHFYCRRQWSLADDPALKYTKLLEFDKAMLSLEKREKFMKSAPRSLYVDTDRQVLVFERGGLVFAFNFSPQNSYTSYTLPVLHEGRYKVILSTDSEAFGGHGRISTDYVYTAESDGETPKTEIYLPARTALCLKCTKKVKEKTK